MFLVSTVSSPHLMWAADQDKIRWDKKYATEKYVFGRKAISFVQDHVDLLPKGALKMAQKMGHVFCSFPYPTRCRQRHNPFTELA